MVVSPLLCLIIAMTLMCLPQESRSQSNYVSEIAQGHEETTERARNMTTERARVVTTEGARNVTTERARNETAERAHSVMTERARNVTIERARSVTTERSHDMTVERARVMTPERAQATPYLVAKSAIELVIDDFDDQEKIGTKPKIKGKNNDCCICLAEFKQGNMCCLILPACCHRFHVACIIPWLAKNKTCPLCRTRVRVVPCPRIDDLLRHSQSLPSSCNDRNCYIISASSILTIPVRPLV